MNKKRSAHSLANAVKKIGNIAAFALEIYKASLAAKLFFTNAALAAVKKQNKNASSRVKTTAVANIEKENKTMKKSNFWGALAFLGAVCAALGAAAYYLYKKEQELTDYENALFEDEYLEGYMPQDGEDCCDCGCETEEECECPAETEEQPAEQL